MKARYVELISTVADAGSLGAAAIRLGKSQPAISKALKAAEHEIGCQIFQRGPTGVVPTIEGQRVVERCQMICRDLNLLDEDLAQIRGDLHGTLNLVVSPVAAVQLLPRVLRRFLRRYPGVQVQVIGGHSRKAFQMLRTRQADYVLGPAPGPDEMAGLRATKLLATETTFVTGVTSRYLTETDPVVLQQAEWLMIGSRERQPLFAHYFQKHGLEPPKPIVCSDSILTIMSLIEGSDFLCSFPALLFPEMSQKWSVAQLDITAGLKEIALAMTAEIGRVPTTAALAFEDMVLSDVAALQKLRP